MGSSTPSAQVFLAEREAQAVQEFVRRYMDDQSMTPSQIEDLIRKGGLKTRLSLKYLKEEDLCDPIKGILQPDFFRGCMSDPCSWDSHSTFAQPLYGKCSMMNTIILQSTRTNSI